MEDPSTGGTQTDVWPTSTNINQDFLDSRGITIQDDTSNDDEVRISRDGDDMTFLDKNNTVKTLSDLVSGGGGLTADAHKILRQLIHFIDEGPAEGFTSDAYKEVTGLRFPTSIVWWESSSKSKKIVEQNITWTGVLPTTVEWKVYDTDGSTVLATVTDTITYTGRFEQSRTRSIVVT